MSRSIIIFTLPSVALERRRTKLLCKSCAIFLSLHGRSISLSHSHCFDIVFWLLFEHYYYCCCCFRAAWWWI